MNMGSAKLLAAKLLVTLASATVCLLVTEAALRVVFDPVDFLRPVLIDDPVLGHRVQSASAGHDEWGLRNKSVPEHADVVAIGDSQTYGVSAMAFESWPAWLQRSTGRSVYNLALGGWGPIQYEYLLEQRALTLFPSAVVIGIYPGNDLIDAYRVVYGLDSWSERRSEDFAEVVVPYRSVRHSDDAWATFSSVRQWVGRHSILYRLGVSTFGQALGRLELSLRQGDPEITVFEDSGIVTAFTPTRRLRALDPRREEVREGRRLTFEAVGRMIALCRDRGVQAIILFIPTKESVFARRIKGRTELPNFADLNRLIEEEGRFREELQAFVEQRGAQFVDPLAAMRKALDEGPIYPSNEGGHPVGAGYRAIASAVTAALE